MATCVENVDDDAGHHLVQVSSKESGASKLWNRPNRPGRLFGRAYRSKWRRQMSFDGTVMLVTFTDI